MYVEKMFGVWGVGGGGGGGGEERGLAFIFGREMILFLP